MSQEAQRQEPELCNSSCGNCSVDFQTVMHCSVTALTELKLLLSSLPSLSSAPVVEIAAGVEQCLGCVTFG